MDKENLQSAGVKEKLMAKVDHAFSRVSDTSVIRLPLQDGTVFEMHLWEPHRGIGVVMSVNDEYLIRVPERTPVHIERDMILLERRKITDDPTGIRRLSEEEYKKHFDEWRHDKPKQVWRTYKPLDSVTDGSSTPKINQD